MSGDRSASQPSFTHPQSHRRVLGPRLKIVFHVVLAKLGYTLFAVALVILVTGLLLVRVVVL